MAKSLNILYVASEAFPFAKESGVADVAASLPIAIRELGHDIRVMIPKYGTMTDRRNKIHGITRLQDMHINVGNELVETCIAKSSSFTTTRVKVQIYVITNERYFETRKGVYHDPVKWIEYSDNLERFIFFCKSVVETCHMLGWYPDIIHCNDWQTALLPVYIRYFYPQKFRKTKSVLTIHNIAYQGEYPMSMFKLLGLPEDAKDSFTHKNKINILKGGMLYANQVTTVSDSYLNQMSKDKTLTNGLNTLVKINYDRIKAIKNGIDTIVWNPKTDESIEHRFKDDFEEYKQSNKIALCDQCKLKYKNDTPLIGMITRITERKGVDVLIDAIEELMQMDVQLVILGQGNAEMKDKLKKYQQKYSKKMSVTFAMNDTFAHLIEAGSDMYLMPSRQEACGLNLFYSLNYGTVPIVNFTGGIKDTAVPYGKKYAEDVNCFAMKKLTTENLIETVKLATEVFKDKETWLKIVETGMSTDYSWKEAAKQYSDMYRQLLKEII